MRFLEFPLDFRGLTSIYIDIPALRPATVGSNVFAVLCTLAAFALRLAVDPHVIGAEYITGTLSGKPRRYGFRLTTLPVHLPKALVRSDDSSSVCELGSLDVRIWPKAADLGDAAKSSAYLGYSRRAANVVGTAGLDPR